MIACSGDGVLVSDGTTTYTHDLAALLSQILADGSATYVYGAGSERLRALDGSWYLGDALGSVRTMLDDAGAVVATASYDPWGTPQGELAGPFGFTGELHRGDQVYLRARWYTPGSGTFTARDPFAGFPEMPYSLHAYQYAYRNPVVFTDPSGLYSSSPVEMMIQIYYEYSHFRLGSGIVVPEFSIYLGSKTGLLLNPAGRLTGEPTGNEGYIDILDMMQDQHIGYAYEIKPSGHPNSNKVSPLVARAEVERYVELYNALPTGMPKSPYHAALAPRMMKLGHLFPHSWQIIGSNPFNPREAIVARQSQHGVIAWQTKAKRRITEPLPSFVFEFDQQSRTVRRQQPTQPSWPAGLVQPQPVCVDDYCVGGSIQESGDCYLSYDPLFPWFFYPVPPEVITPRMPVPARIPIPIP